MENYAQYKPNLTGMTPQQALPNAQGQTSAMPMQGIDAATLQAPIQDSYVANRASQLAEINPLVQAGVAIPVWYGLSKAMEQFNKNCRGDYDKTIEYKFTHAGDAITDRFNNSSFGKSDFIRKLNERLSKWHISLNKKIDSRSAILRAMRDTPSIPEMEMVRGQANGMKGLQLFDYPQLQKKFMETVKHPEDLDCYGADKEFINRVKNLISSTSTKESKLKYIQDAEFELLSKKPEYIDDAAKTLDEFKMMGGTDRIKVLQNMKAKASGYANFAEWESIEKNIQERIPRVIEALHNSDKNMFTRMWTHDHNIIGKAQGEFFGRKVYTSETLNKLISELGSIKHDTQLQDVLQRTGWIKQVPKSALGKAFG